MESVNFTVLGEQDMAGRLGKKGTHTDLALYDRKERDTIRTFVTPCGFPEKIQPLFEAIALGDFIIFHIGQLDRFTGEQIVALDLLKKRQGLLSHSYNVDGDTLDKMIGGTAVQDYKRVEPDCVAQAVSGFSPASTGGSTKIAIDHRFDVRGAGTVVLGKVVSGMVQQYDTLFLLPSGTEVAVKSIQMHDDPVKSAESPARVGLSLKGVRPDDISRGDMLCADPGSVTVARELDLDFETTPYSDPPSKGQTCMASMGLATVSCRIESADAARVVFGRPIVHDNQECILLRPESDGIRIMGRGRIV